MSGSKVLQQVVGVQGMVVEGVEVQADPDRFGQVLVVSVRCDSRSSGRCPPCRRSCPGYDRGVGVRRWPAIDTGTVVTFLQAAAPRVSCPEHGVQVAHVSWARPQGRVAGGSFTLRLPRIPA